MSDHRPPQLAFTYEPGAEWAVTLRLANALELVTELQRLEVVDNEPFTVQRRRLIYNGILHFKDRKSIAYPDPTKPDPFFNATPHSTEWGFVLYDDSAGMSRNRYQGFFQQTPGSETLRCSVYITSQWGHSIIAFCAVSPVLVWLAPLPLNWPMKLMLSLGVIGGLCSWHFSRILVLRKHCIWWLRGLLEPELTPVERERLRRD